MLSENLKVKGALHCPLMQIATCSGIRHTLTKCHITGGFQDRALYLTHQPGTINGARIQASH
jgi:hypothetical protein